MIPTKSATGPLMANNQDLVFTTHHEAKAKKKKKRNTKFVNVFILFF